jgi:hypothetical protein
MDIGVFIPIGWLISTASPQYKPGFAPPAAQPKSLAMTG